MLELGEVQRAGQRGEIDGQSGGTANRFGMRREPQQAPGPAYAA